MAPVANPHRKRVAPFPAPLFCACDPLARNPRPTKIALAGTNLATNRRSAFSIDLRRDSKLIPRTQRRLPRTRLIAANRRANWVKTPPPESFPLSSPFRVHHGPPPSRVFLSSKQE